MSAYLITPSQCLVMAAYASYDSWKGIAPVERVQEKFAALWHTNVQSLRTRYPENFCSLVYWKPADYRARITETTIRAAMQDISLAKAAKIWACAKYQCCEYRGYFQSKGGIVLREAVSEIMRQFYNSAGETGAWPEPVVPGFEPEYEAA